MKNYLKRNKFSDDEKEALFQENEETATATKEKGQPQTSQR